MRRELITCKAYRKQRAELAERILKCEFISEREIPSSSEACKNRKLRFFPRTHNGADAMQEEKKEA